MGLSVGFVGEGGRVDAWDGRRRERGSLRAAVIPSAHCTAATTSREALQTPNGLGSLASLGMTPLSRPAFPLSRLPLSRFPLPIPPSP